MNKAEFRAFTVFILIYLICLFFPSFGIFAVVFVPYAVLRFVRFEKAMLWPYMVLVMILSAGAVLVSTADAVFFVSGAVIPPLILKVLHDNGYRYTWRTLLCAPLPLFVIYTAVLLLNPELRQAISGIVTDGIDQLYHSLPMTDAARLDTHSAINRIYQGKEQFADSVVRFSPAFVYAFGILVIYFTERFFFRLPDETVIELPDFLLAFLVLTGLCLLAPWAESRVVGVSGLFILGALYFCRGLDILRYYLGRLKVNSLLRMMLYALIILNEYMAVAVCVLGLVSVYKNLVRKDNVPGKQG